ncbi:aminoacyl-tRNA hydrolase [Clostridium oryzae]|uniref:Peptidyl-tRNA hydrolase n=1 Tax=Clostridium oryzae TaxID=1450648 RepID=A0A1V4IM25_9CLOT|nr:aminoacyl-tRNA hydrolase [Clostridium oryzae]OPJ61081.1 peptidyl-tRNA hydrolase [Clostridium oryzae]
MFLIVGLGNPGSEYTGTRHNIGFGLVDLAAKKYNIVINRIKFKGEYGEGKIGNEKVVLLKPQTYMNLSGESLAEVVKFYKIPLENIIVIYDDMSLQLGRLRIRPKGSSGGHNGIKSIIKCLGSDTFPRIKIGVGQPKGDWISHVMGKFNSDDRNKIDTVYDQVLLAIETIVSKGIDEAMNKFNSFSA